MDKPEGKGPHKGSIHILIIGMPKKMGKTGTKKPAPKK